MDKGKFLTVRNVDRSTLLNDLIIQDTAQFVVALGFYGMTFVCICVTLFYTFYVRLSVEITQIWPGKSSFLKCESKDIYIPPELSGIIGEASSSAYDNR